jgi:hypothetical protein
MTDEGPRPPRDVPPPGGPDSPGPSSQLPLDATPPVPARPDMPIHPVPPPPPGTGPAPQLREMRIGEMLDAAVRLYREHWKVLLGIAAFVLVPYFFIQEALVAAVTRDVTTNLGGLSVQTQEGATAAAVVSIVFGLGYFLFIQPFLTAAMARATADLYVGGRADIVGTYRFALPHTHSILWVSLLTFLAVAGGFILLIIPGIIFYVRFLFGPTVVVVEGTKGTQAMRRSWRLVKGHTGKVLGTVFLAGLLAAIIGGILSVPFVIAGNLMGTGGWILRAIGSSLSAVITRPFAAIIAVLLYFDMRIRKEGLDLALMARELESSGS